MHLATVKPISGSLSPHTFEENATRQCLPVLEHSQRMLDARENPSSAVFRFLSSSISRIYQFKFLPANVVSHHFVWVTATHRLPLPTSEKGTNSSLEPVPILSV